MNLGKALLSGMSGSALPTTIGQMYGGGYYVGDMQYSDGVYALIVAPAASTLNVSWRASAAVTLTLNSVFDGLPNTTAINDANHDAARLCRQYTGGGYTDWYLPARDEQNLIFWNLKPTTDQPNFDGSSGSNTNSVPNKPVYSFNNPLQTTVTLFQAGNSEAFYASNVSGGTDVYWTSTVAAPGGTNLVRRYNMKDGTLGQADGTSLSWARAVRKVKKS